jgi:RNA polymerase-binding transcription factor
VDDRRARQLIDAERARVEALLVETAAAARADRPTGDEPGDMVDSAAPLTAEGADDAVVAALRDRLGALERAERRLDAGTFGVSVRSGQPIPDERLEADPAAELTVEESRLG